MSFTAAEVRNVLRVSNEQAKAVMQALHAIEGIPGASEADVDTVLDAMNAALGGFGVEALPVEGAWVDSYYRNFVALYVNQGDTYDPTVVFDTETGEFSLMSWGDFLEDWEAQHPELAHDSTEGEGEEEGEPGESISEEFDRIAESPPRADPEV